AYLNFMVLMCSHSRNSMRQYGILTSQLGGPSPRHLRTLVAKSYDTPQNPIMDAVGYKGPIAVAGDCTKVYLAQLAYSTNFGGHILSSTLPLDECQVDKIEDIENIINSIHKAKAEAKQVHAILAKIPLPQYPPQVVALLPTTGKDNACGIHEQLMSLLHMAARLEIHIISFAGDDAASKLLSQCMMDHEASVTEPFTYSHPLYGIHLQAPVLKTEGQQCTIQDSFEGIFVYLFVFGLLFNAWISHEMDIQDHVLCALQAHFFLHIWKEHISALSKAYPDLYSTSCSFISSPSFHIFNHLCDTLVLLASIFTKEYPEQPFCPWLLGTKFVEHFFGLACMLSPDFAYAELVKIVQHVMETSEKDTHAGYILDVNTTPLSNDQFQCAKFILNPLQLNWTVELTFREAMLICHEILHIPTARPHEGHHLCLAPPGVSNARLTTTQPGTSSHDDVVSNDGLTDMDLNSSDSDSDLDLEPQDTLEGGSKFSDAVTLTAQLIIWLILS
ncbi:hypothetical protein BDR06DRAFT_947803, partial [Suillus hirtellus]